MAANAGSSQNSGSRHLSPRQFGGRQATSSGGSNPSTKKEEPQSIKDSDRAIAATYAKYSSTWMT